MAGHGGCRQRVRMRHARAVLRATAGALVVLASIGSLRAQEASPVRPAPVVAGYAVFGNAVTRPEVILREMTLEPGDTISADELEFCRARIYSLGLFNAVDISYPPMDSTVLIIEVEERWFYYPVPMLGVVDRDLNHWYYGLGLVHQNVRGRNEKLWAAAVAGYNPSAQLSYANPWIFGTAQLFTDTQLAWTRVQNKSLVARGDGENFTENRYSIAQSLGKRFDAYRSAWLSAGFTYVGVSSWKPGRTASSTGIDRVLSIGAGAVHDTRNLREYTTQGFYGAASVVKKGVGFGEVDYTRATLDMRAWQRAWGGVSVGARVLTSVAAGPVVPYYERVFYGYAERIRGRFSEHREGDNIAGLWLETRIPIVPEWMLRLPPLPVNGFSTLRFGLYAAVFADAGLTWDRGERVRAANAARGYGVGLHLLLPYGSVVRLERAWDHQRAGEWILDIAASF